MRTPTGRENQSHHDDDDDVKVVLTSPASSTSTQQLLDPLGNKIGEVELNTFDNFSYASESFSTIIDRVVWGEQDTNLLLEKYELYISEVGPRKRFHSKKYMWNQIANDIYAKFKLIITGGQCENRYKTICKRRKQLTENNSKSNNSKTTEEDRSDELESEAVRSEGLQIHFERLEQTNQELTQQIEQCSVRVLTMVERLEKHHSRQQLRFEKLVQDNKDQLKTDFTTLFEKLDKIHNSIQQNQEQQQQLLQKLIEGKHNEHKTEMATLLNILDKIYLSMTHNSGSKKQDDHACTTVTGKKDDMKRSRSRSRSLRKDSKSRSSHSPPKKRRHPSITRSRSSSKCNYKSPTLHTSKRSRSNERHTAGSRSSNTRNNQPSPHTSRSSKYDRRHRSKSRSPRRSNHRSCQDASCKHEKYR